MIFNYFYYFMFYATIGLITTINVLALKEFYWDSIRLHVAQIQEVHDVVKKWEIVCLIYVSMGIISFKQWLNNTVTALPDGKYLLTHMLNGKIVKIIVKPSSKLPSSVVDEDYEECYVDEAIPFLRYEQEPFCNKTIGVSKQLILHY